jgi:kanamycin kinase
MIVAAVPQGPVEVPAVVERLAGHDEPVPVWRNTLGGLTFRLGPPDAARFVKWSPPGAPSLEREAARLTWASSYVRVPRVLDAGVDGTGSWMLTAGIPGRSAVDARFASSDASARVAARAIGTGLRELHDRLPVDECPYSWSVSHRIEQARENGMDVPVALQTAPQIDHLVVCHGDACAPNTLVAHDGSFAAHVDLGSLGLADRWADLAVASWSLDWNFSGGAVLEQELFAGYGIAPDEARIRYYRALWAAT